MAIHPFGDLEGLRIAMEMERRGAEFYRRAAKISKTAEAVALLNQLCADEQNHRAEFTALYEKQLEKHEDGADEWYDGEASAYLSAVAADVVFSGGLMELGRDNGFDSPKSILKSAIQSEKDAVLFYGEIISLSHDGETREVFGEILRQEKAHMASLEEMLEKQK